MSITHLSDEQLSAHLDGAVDAEVTVHLAGCQACAQRLQMLRATSQAVGSLPDTEPARPLDLSFLHPIPVAAPATDGRPGFIPRVIRGRVSTWAPSAVATAAVLALAITWAPRLLPAGSPSSSAAGSSRQALSTTATGKVSPTASGNTQDQLFGSVVGGGAAPSLGLPSTSAQRSATGSDGTNVTILANPTRGTTGHAVQLLLRVVGGPKGTNLAPPGMEIFLAQGQNQLRLAGTEGTSRTLKPGEELDLTVEWTAGALAGPPAAGSYSMIGRVFLAGGKLIEVSLPYSVAG